MFARIKCDVCGHVFAETDDHIAETAPADYYPYEGEIITFYCPGCGYLSVFTEEGKRA